MKATPISRSHCVDLLALGLPLCLSVACASDTHSGNGASAGPDDGGAVVTDCGLPDLAASGVPRPSGTPGQLTILDWAGHQGAVSYTFDDANRSQIEHYPALAALGVPMTFYLQTGKSDASNMIWEQALLDGHELGNHTQRHAQTGTEEDVDAASAFIESQFGVRPWTMAAPYGDSSYSPLAQTRFLINRGVSNRIIKPNDASDPFNLPCYVPPEGASADAMFGQVESAWSAGGWRVVLVHGFTGGTDGAYQPVDIEAFVGSVEQAKALDGLWLDTVKNIGAYWRAQKVVSQVTPTEADGVQSWSWTLPDNFPPGQCLRVQVSGGTLAQGGQTLEWNDHGYYEISLDVGSLTLRP